MKKRLFILVLISILIIPSMVSAKTYQAEIFGYGGTKDDLFTDVTSTKDGGYVTVGRSDSIDISGLTNKGNSDAIIIKYDKNDKIEWQQNYGGSSYEDFSKVVETEDGGYITIGSTSSNNIQGITHKGNGDALIVKYDKDGNVEWQQNYGGGDTDNFNSVSATHDGGYIAVGQSWSFIDNLITKGSSDAIIVKYDKNGNMEWQQSYGGYNTDVYKEVTEDEEGNYVVVGYSNSTSNIEGLTSKGGTDAIIIKYDKNGNLLWQQNYGGSNTDYFNSIGITNDDGYIVLADIYSNNVEGLPNKETPTVIVKYDKEGKIKWQKNYTYENYGIYLSDIYIDEDGSFVTVGDGYVSCGEEEEEPEAPARVIEPLELANTCGMFMTIAEYDEDGNIKWQGNYGGNKDDSLYGITITESGEYVAAGVSYSTDIEGVPNKGKTDAIVLKIKPIYDITEEEPKNGEFTAIEEDRKGKIEIKPDPGYVVDKITVTDSQDNEVPTSKDGDYYYFELYDDVKVRVTFKEATILDLINPETGSGQVIEFIVIVCLIIGGLVYFNKKKVFGTK